MLVAQDLVHHDIHLVGRYLADAEELLGDDGEAYKKAIVDRYPGYGGRFLIDSANRYLFGGGHA